ncbi:transposon Ty3-I Gag-Pol polyprotein [Trichonephila clavata]|uniref:Transposon Ty3-I Gag-Pol polyprotein n=1 Tax=Trichonephila clavata TaxID=2740835 RepID=A0A8X6JAX6_TRICU|nr:transposon Ty3-I Gag-Pol polyprotein [Trichonephila clavata]
MSGNHLDVIVDGLPVKALVDSGALSTVISEKFRRYLKKVMFPAYNHTVLKVANGSYVRPKDMCTLQIRISGRILPFEFIVLPDYSHDIILGWNFLKDSKALIDCGRSELTLEDVEVTSEEVVLKPLRLCVMKDCRLPAYAIMKIPVVNHCTEDSGNVIVKGSQLLALKKGFYAFNTSHFKAWKNRNIGRQWTITIKGHPSKHVCCFCRTILSRLHRYNF